MPVKYVHHKHPSVSNLHTNSQVRFRCKSQICPVQPESQIFTAYFLLRGSFFCLGRNALSAFKYRPVDRHVLSEAPPSQTQLVWCKKTMTKTRRSAMLCTHDGPAQEFLFFSFLFFFFFFFPRVYSSSSVVICPLHASAAQQGSPGSTSPHRRARRAPTLPSPPTLSPAGPTMSLCSHAPPVCLAGLSLIRPEAPRRPVPWCQHFHRTQSWWCCVTDGMGDQKQQPGLKRKPAVIRQRGSVAGWYGPFSSVNATTNMRAQL